MQIMEYQEEMEHVFGRPNNCHGGYCTKKEQVEQAFAMIYTFMSSVRCVNGGRLVEFVNVTAENVDLLWRDFDDDDIPIIKLGPWESRRISTLVTHNWNCRHTLTGKSYFLNAKLTLSGTEFIDAPYQNVVQITAPRTPASLKEITASSVYRHIKEPREAFVLPLPQILQNDLYNLLMPPFCREYYSRNGENGVFRKSYDGRDQGPWIYPTAPTNPTSD